MRSAKFASLIFPTAKIRSRYVYNNRQHCGIVCFDSSRLDILKKGAGVKFRDWYHPMSNRERARSNRSRCEHTTYWRDEGWRGTAPSPCVNPSSPPPLFQTRSEQRAKPPPPSVHSATSGAQCVYVTSHTTPNPNSYFGGWRHACTFSFTFLAPGSRLVHHSFLLKKNLFISRPSRTSDLVLMCVLSITRVKQKGSSTTDSHHN